MASKTDKTTNGNGPNVASNSYDLIRDLGDGLSLYLVPVDSLREQDVNARLMPTAEYNQLVNNIKKRGRLESVPYCVKENGRIEIVSGHHRVRAAREAGLKECAVLVDESGISRSEIVAKQLAHNKLSGFDDASTLSKLFAMLETPDDILQSGLAEDMINQANVAMDSLLTPHMDMDWKVVSFSFLPHQFKNLQSLIDTIPPSDMVVVGMEQQFDTFMKAVVKLSRLKDVRNAAIVIALIVERMVQEAENEKREKDEANETGSAKDS
jgi:hypothetical protein